MRVEVELLGVLRGRLGRDSLSLEVSSPSTGLRDLLRHLRASHPDLREAVDEEGGLTTSYIAFINGVDYRLLGGLEYALRDGDRVSLVPISHGG
ncbi:MAG: MoaD/ThiS family protein [Zestosphaera sp.]